MVVILVQTELWLDCRTVNTICMQALSDSLRQFHISLATSFTDGEPHLNVHGRNYLRVTQLPDVNMVAADNAWKLLDIFLDVIDLDVVRSGLKQDLGGS